MHAEVVSTKTRLYELDWLRTGAIVLVVAYHVGMFFCSWEFHIKSDQVVRSIEPIMVWMHCWRMPLLLFVSGIGTAFMLRSRSIGRFLIDRHNRLMIPLVFGMFVVVPPQIYVEKQAAFASFWDFYPLVFEFQSYPEGNFSWHHLWFVLYLFLYGVAAIPLFVFFRSDRSRKLRRLLGECLSVPGAMIASVFPLLMTEILLRKQFPDDTHALFADWACFSYYFWFFLGGYLIMTISGLWETLKRDRWIYTILALLSAVGLEAMFFGKIPGYHIHQYNVVWGALKIATGCFTIFALVGWSQVVLRRKSERLIRWNRAGYPVYILHQTILLLAAGPMIHWKMSWLVQFVLLFGVSLFGSYLLYHYLIQPVPLLRVFFGLKWHNEATKTDSNNKADDAKNFQVVEYQS